MDDYSFLADLLNKFYLVKDWVKAFWIASASVTIYGIVLVVREIVSEIIDLIKLIILFRNDDKDKKRPPFTKRNCD